MSIVINMIGGKGGGGSAIPSFDYTGTYRINKSGSKWEIAFLASGTLTPRRPMLCDIFAAAAGRSGGNASVDGPNYYGGAGGYGGARKTFRAVQLSAGPIVVTVGENGGASSIGTYSASGTSDAAPGRGGWVGTNGYQDENIDGVAGGDGALAFDGEDCLSFPGRKFGAAGGGAGGVKGSDYSYGANGGATGAGNGGTRSNGGDGGANTGSAGGGASNGYSPGAGGSGIVILRGGY